MSGLSNWFLVIGMVLVSMALVGSVVQRLPFTPAIVYLAFGYAMGSGGTGLHPVLDAGLIRALAEIAVAISLFAVGLKLRLPLTRRAWRVPLALGLPAMVLTIVLLTVAARLICGLPWALALVLAAILAPTDPVLGADVQIERPGDRDYVRFGLTGEGGLNDGLAAPAVMLGLGFLGRYDLGSLGWHWFWFDCLWVPLGGLAVGWLLGLLTWQLVLYLRSRHALAIGLEEFLGFGVIGLAYGAAGLCQASGFLAVFAAGLALRNIERRHSLTARLNPETISLEDDGAATDPDRAAAHMARALLAFNAQAEHIVELGLVMVLGALLASIDFHWQAAALAAALFLVARPLAVLATLAGSQTTRFQAGLIAWFGIRGIGSVYYLGYVIEGGIDGADASRLADLVLTVVAISIVVHGISATPLMRFYGGRRLRVGKR